MVTLQSLWARCGSQPLLRGAKCPLRSKISKETSTRILPDTGLRKHRVSEQRPPCAQPTGTDDQEAADEKSKEYSEVMQRRMGGSLIYVHEEGINFAHIMPDLIVGSCPQTAEDVTRLAEQEGVGTILCLQEDTDMEYFGLDLRPLQQRCEEVGVQHVRVRVRDFDPFDLRRQLPAAVSAVMDAFERGKGKVYIHCTAGLGRAPGVAVAFMHWSRGLGLEEAFEQLYAVRRCHPKLDAIRASTCDLLFAGDELPVTIAVYRTGVAQSVQIAGLDVGWGQRLDMERKQRCFELTRRLPPGQYNYKFITDGRWSCSADHPIILDGVNYNNYVRVAGSPESAAARASIMEGKPLTAQQREQLLTALKSKSN